MDTISATRTQRRAAATRQSIIDAAKAILAEMGAAALTIETVADRADVAVQTIYNRVGGRSAILLAVAELAMVENRDYMDEAYALPGTIEERLLRTATAYTRFALERPHEFRLLIEPPDDPEALSRIAGLIDEQNSKLAATISDGVTEGVIDSVADPRLLADALWAMWNGMLSLGWRTDSLRVEPDQMPQLLNTAADVILAGLRHRP